MATRKKQGGEACSAVGCSNARNKIDCEGLAFFRFPKDEERCRQWVQNSRRLDLIGKTSAQLNKSYLFCRKHFEPNQFLRPDDPRSRLKHDGKPTIFDVPNPPPKVKSSRKSPRKRQAPAPQRTSKKQRVHETDQGEELSLPTEPTPSSSHLHKDRVQILKQRLKSSGNKLYRVRVTVKRGTNRSSIAQRKANIVSELSHFLPMSSVRFIQSQLKAVGKKKKGVRWSEEDKALALSLFHASPKAYRLLKKMFLLPAVRTLQRVMRNTQVYPGFSQAIFDALALKLKSLSPSDKVCAIIFDEMSINESVAYDAGRDRVEGFEDFGDLGRSEYAANHATVFMVRGLKSKWKQPVGYVLSSGPIDSAMLHSLLMHCISKTEQAGLTVKAVIADQGSNNRKTFNTHLKISENEPFFLHEGRKVYVIYDPPHLLKNIRNNLKNKGFLLDGETISWQHVEDLFRFDKENNVRIAPKLTERHISLPPFSSLKVRYAAQVLSHSVAAGIQLLSRLHVLPEEATATANFIEQFDQLFNAFNSRNLSSSKVMGNAISSQSGHEEFFERMLAWLDKVQPISESQLPCLTGWKMAIRAVQGLWADLHEQFGFKFLLTDRLNQDCLENFFSQIRGNSGRVENPSAAALRKWIRQAMVAQIFVHSDGSNCEDDSSHFLLKLKCQANEEPASTEVADDEEDENESVFRIAMPLPPPKDCDLQKVEDNVLAYIAGYIAMKLKMKFCDPCNSMLTGTLSGRQDEMLLETKQFPNLDKEKGLQVPSPQLVEAVKVLEIAYVSSVDKIIIGDNVRARLRSILKEKMSQTVLSCPLAQSNTEKLIVDKFLSVRLHFTLKICSSSFHQKCLKRNKKMMKLSHQ